MLGRCRAIWGAVNVRGGEEKNGVILSERRLRAKDLFFAPEAQTDTSPGL